MRRKRQISVRYRAKSLCHFGNRTVNRKTLDLVPTCQANSNTSVPNMIIAIRTIFGQAKPAAIKIANLPYPKAIDTTASLQ